MVNQTWSYESTYIDRSYLFRTISHIIIYVLNYNDEDNGTITITENAELRTGPNAAYPVIYKIEKGDTFEKIDKSGKWIEVKNKAGDEKGGLLVGTQT